MSKLSDLANAISPASPNIRAFAQEAAAEIDALNAKVFPPVVTPPSAYPPFTPARTVNVTTPAQFTAALGNLTAGDLVKVSGTYPGQWEVTKQLAAWAVLDLTAAKLTGSSSANVSLWLGDCAFVRVIGGDISNPHGDGLRGEEGTHDTEVYDTVIHDTGWNGALVQGVTSSLDRIKLVRTDISRWGLNNGGAFDQWHGVYWGGGAYGYASGTLQDLHVHDGDFGSGLQFGPYAKDTACTNPLVERITGAHWYPPGTSNGAGNAFDIYGGKVTGLTITGAHGSGISGNVVDADGSLNKTPGSVLCTGFRFTAPGRSPAYIPQPGISYVDCQP